MAEETSKIRKVLNNEIAQIVSIIVLVYSFIAFVILPIRSMEQEIENIKTNHLHTIQMDMAEIKTLNEKNADDNNEEHANMTEHIIKTATILDQHISK